MANATSWIRNQDYDIVQIMVVSTGTKKFTLDRSQAENLDGPEGDTFKYAWKTRNETITGSEFDAYAAAGTYGVDIVLGTPPGNVP